MAYLYCKRIRRRVNRALVTALKELRATIESADLEKRLRTIELRLGMRT